MRKLIVAVTAALVAAAPAGAGGFATVGVSPLPSGDSQVWTPTLTVLAHGVTPMDGAQPVVTIRNVATGETHMFRAEPAGAVGEYRARVEFPSPGTWAYEVREWEGGTAHTFKPVEIAPPAAATPAATGPDGPWTAVAAAAILAALALLVLLGRHRRASGGAAPAAR